MKSKILRDQGVEKNSQSTLAFSYRRYSSSNQDDNTSLDRQLEMAKEVCAQQGWILIDLPPDKKLSGYTGANRIKGELGKLFEKIQKKEIPVGSVLIIERMDRFSRNEVHLVLPDFLNLLNAGLSIYSCADHQHYSMESITGPMRMPVLFSMLIAMCMANDYSKNLSDRVKRAFTFKIHELSNGRIVRLGGWLPRWISFNGDKEGGKYILNNKAVIVKQIIRDYLSGSSLYSIAKSLNYSNTLTLTGKKVWGQAMIQSILQSKFLGGDVEIKGVKIKGYLPAVITEKDYRRLVVKLDQCKSRKGGGEYIRNLFRNRCVCAHCGGVVINHKKKYLVCRNIRFSMYNVDCKSHGSILADDFELHFFIYFLMKHPEELMEKDTEKQTRKEELEYIIAEEEKQIDRLIRLMDTDKKMPIDKIQSKLSGYQIRKDEAQAELNKLLNTSAVNSSINIQQIIHDLLITGEPDNYDRMCEEIESKLKQNEVRKHLLSTLPSLVKSITFDITSNSYQVVNSADRKSDWIKIEI